jgi:hypothetical protein
MCVSINRLVYLPLEYTTGIYIYIYIYIVIVNMRKIEG